MFGSFFFQDDRYQSIGVLGLALIAMNEDIGADMALRSFGHLLQYGEEGIRRAVPLALGLLCASNPKLTVLDTLSKLSHDADAEVWFRRSCPSKKERGGGGGGGNISTMTGVEDSRSAVPGRAL